VNYRTTSVVRGGGGANHHDDEDVPPRIVTDNSSNFEQGQEQPSWDEPISLSRNLRSVLGRQCNHVSRTLEDSGYSSDASEENASRSPQRNRSSNDATGEVSDDLEVQTASDRVAKDHSIPKHSASLTQSKVFMEGLLVINLILAASGGLE
jgi:hypothetical protein